MPNLNILLVVYINLFTYKFTHFEQYGNFNNLEAIRTYNKI